ncbi:TetR/AcrR family transcriptional regulator [Clostridium sp. OS1-26]|uniref:TetR/AcrR family transcriptional regulator n=1 Tax=Clostridium sp. OS1-26 TaxID=3070681 RepID=UPI0027DEEDF2|nr:TetR/AcrR family transcriptional regulator [Clostridium sp. OS1-26]WML35969.1 TetR/AcrR family transcriptional regulator [Clostridium sp. OS1-26]
MDIENKEIIEKLLSNEGFSEEEMTKRQWQILEAAVKVFSAKGFDGSRTSEIAKEADVAEGTIFRYYKTKKDLLMGLLIPLITKFFRPMILDSAERIIKNEEDKPVEEVINNLLIDRFYLIDKNLPLIKTVFMEAAYQPELLETLRKDLAPKLIPFINFFIESNIKNNNFRDLEPKLVTRTLMSLLLGYVIFSNTFPDFFQGENHEDELRKIVDIFLNGVSNI